MSRNRLGKVAFLTALIAVSLPMLSPTSPSRAADKSATRSALEGTWHTLEGKVHHYKFITNTKYINTWVKGGVLLHAFGGKCQIQGNKYTETVEFVAPTAKLGTVGASATFEWTITGDKVRFVGDLDDGNGKKFTYDSKFERVKGTETP